MRKIILLAGYTTAPGYREHGSIGAGKTTVAKALTEFYKVSFADQLRLVANQLWPWLDHNNKDADYRKKMEGLSSALKEIDPLIFIRATCNRIESCGLNIVIDDCRTHAELEFMEKYCKLMGYRLFPIMLNRGVSVVRISNVEQALTKLRGEFAQINNNDELTETVAEARKIVQ
jgi:hypothetical protein